MSEDTGSAFHKTEENAFCVAVPNIYPFSTAADELGGEGIVSFCSIDKKNKAQRD